LIKNQQLNSINNKLELNNKVYEPLLTDSLQMAVISFEFVPIFSPNFIASSTTLSEGNTLLTIPKQQKN